MTDQLVEPAPRVELLGDDQGIEPAALPREQRQQHSIGSKSPSQDPRPQRVRARVFAQLLDERDRHAVVLFGPVRVRGALGEPASLKRNVHRVVIGRCACRGASKQRFGQLAVTAIGRDQSCDEQRHGLFTRGFIELSELKLGRIGLSELAPDVREIQTRRRRRLCHTGLRCELQRPFEQRRGACVIVFCLQEFPEL
jgi:hypothetical protein